MLFINNVLSTARRFLLMKPLVIISMQNNQFIECVSLLTVPISRNCLFPVLLQYNQMFHFVTKRVIIIIIKFRSEAYDLLCLINVCLEYGSVVINLKGGIDFVHDLVLEVFIFLQLISTYVQYKSNFLDVF